MDSTVSAIRDGYEVNSKGRVVHRIVWAMTYGTRLPTVFVIHHADGCKRNNHPDNLVALTPGVHSDLHEEARRNGRLPTADSLRSLEQSLLNEYWSLCADGDKTALRTWEGIHGIPEYLEFLSKPKKAAVKPAVPLSKSALKRLRRERRRVKGRIRFKKVRKTCQEKWGDAYIPEEAEVYLSPAGRYEDPLDRQVRLAEERKYAYWWAGHGTECGQPSNQMHTQNQKHIEDKLKETVKAAARFAAYEKAKSTCTK